VPFRKKGLGSAVIDCMGAIGGVIHPAIAAYWGDNVPALKEHLEGMGMPVGWQHHLFCL